jgi:hypothetical protein
METNGTDGCQKSHWVSGESTVTSASSESGATHWVLYKQREKKPSANACLRVYVWWHSHGPSLRYLSLIVQSIFYSALVWRFILI